MKGYVFVLSMLLLSSCASERPPQLEEFVVQSPMSLYGELNRSCAAIYPQGKWQFVHAIEFSMDNGSGNSVIGVIVLDGNKLSCALMTIEGFTLFEARLTDRLEVLRAVPPFDKPEFAAGLIADVQAIFIQPQGQDVRYGHLVGNVETCRMTSGDGQVTDVMPSEKNCWQIKTYDSEQVLNRTIIARSCRKIDSAFIPGEVELTVSGPTGYTLKMTLISADNPAKEITQ